MSLLDDDPYRPAQWALSRIGAEQAGATSTGAGIRIGIVDSGIDLTHEDLSGAVVAHTNCIGSDGDPARCRGSAQDDNGHGTHVAGFIAARAHNGTGVAGVAPEAQLVIAKALDATGTGTVADIVAGIKWVVDHGAQVVNLSPGDPNLVFTSLFGTPMAEGVEYAWARGPPCWPQVTRRPGPRQLQLRRPQRHRGRDAPTTLRGPSPVGNTAV